MANHQVWTEEVSSQNMGRSVGTASQSASSAQMRLVTLRATKRCLPISESDHYTLRLGALHARAEPEPESE
jgi:hypothetical protein